MVDESDKTTKIQGGPEKGTQGGAQRTGSVGSTAQASGPVPAAQSSATTKATQTPAGGATMKAEPVSFTNLEEEKAGTPSSENLELILDLPLQVSVQLGSARIFIKDLLQLGQGSVIELEKLVGEPMEVLVNDKLVAMGEVVVVNEKFGVRLTDIVSPVERIKQLK